MFRRLLFGLWCFFSATVFAESAVGLELSADRTEVVVGESFQMALQIKMANSNSGMTLEKIPIQGLENFRETASSQSAQMQATGGSIAMVSKAVKTLVALQAGKFPLGPAQIQTRDEAGNPVLVQSNQLMIHVTEEAILPVPGDPEPAHERASQNQNPTKSDGRIKLFLALFFLGGAGTLWFYSQKSKKERTENQKVLDAKVVELVLPEKEAEDFYKKLQQAIFAYIQNETGIPVQSKTSQETLDLVKGDRSFELIKEVLEACDAYRYARGEGDREYLLKLASKITRGV